MQKKEARFAIFQERFLKERQQRGLSQADFAIFLGISRPTVGFYENGERLPDALILKKIAEKCEVTSDYLLGLSNSRKPENADIGERLGLSDNAINVLELYKQKFHEEALIPTINLLIEQEMPLGWHEFSMQQNDDIPTPEELAEFEKMTNQKMQEIVEEWDSHKYIDLLSSIENYLTIELNDSELIDITKTGQITKRGVIKPNDFALKSVSSKTIIEKVFLMEIQEKAAKLKEKLMQSKAENTQTEGEENGDSSAKKE